MTAALLREDAIVSGPASPQIPTSVRERSPPPAGDAARRQNPAPPHPRARRPGSASALLLAGQPEAGHRRRPLGGTTVAGCRAAALPRSPAAPPGRGREDRRRRGDAGARRRPDGLRAAEQHHGDRRARSPVARLISPLMVPPVSGTPPIPAGSVPVPTTPAASGAARPRACPRPRSVIPASGR